MFVRDPDNPGEMERSEWVVVPVGFDSGVDNLDAVETDPPQPAVELPPDKE